MSEEEKDVNLIYSLPVPANCHVVNIDGSIGEARKYRDVFKELEMAGQNDLFIIKLNTPGGLLDTTIQLCSAIRETPARTRAVIYNASSAGSIIALSCYEVAIAQYGSMMIHNVSSGYWGKMSEITAHASYLEKATKTLFETVYAGFLTKQEINDVLNNKDFYFDKPEIERRVMAWSKYHNDNNKRMNRQDRPLIKKKVKK